MRQNDAGLHDIRWQCVLRSCVRGHSTDGLIRRSLGGHRSAHTSASSRGSVIAFDMLRCVLPRPHPPQRLISTPQFSSFKNVIKSSREKQVGNCMLENKEPASDAWTAPLSPLLHYWASSPSAGVLRSLTNQNQGTPGRNY